jgi:hypothetical protein
MEIKVYRCPNDSGTPGAVFIDDNNVCLSLELYSPKEGDSRIKGKCCVPLGKYNVVPRFEGTVFSWMKDKNPDVAVYGIPHIQNIDGVKYPVWIDKEGIQADQFVLIHIGNHLQTITEQSDTEGCLLVGMSSVQENTLNDSTEAFKKLFDIIKEPMKAGNLTIEYLEA